MSEIDSFLSLLQKSPDGGHGTDTADVLRAQLDKGRRNYVDVSGNGTLWRTNGIRHGVAFAVGEVELRPDGLVSVRVAMNQTFSTDEKIRYAHKLYTKFNADFKVPGLAVRDGRALFECEPFDPVSNPRTVDDIMGLALSTVHAYAYIWSGLEAGVDPWDLLDEDSKTPSGSGGSSAEAEDDDEELADEDLAGIERLLRSLSSAR